MVCCKGGGQACLIQNGVKAAMLAPTAITQQKFNISLEKL